MSVPNPIIVPMTVSSNNVVVPMNVSSVQEQVPMSINMVIVTGMPAHYDGAYEFQPTGETQTIQIKDMMADANIIIDPIPSNYGKITWKGIGIHIS